MDDLTVAVVPVGDDRFSIWLVERLGGTPKRGPDAGEDYEGYTEDEVRLVLADRYGWPSGEIDERIASANAGRITVATDPLA